MAQVNILPTETPPTGSGTVQQVTEVGTVGRARASEAAARAVQPDAPPTAVSGTVIAFPGVTFDDKSPRRQYLTEREVEQLCAAARKRGRYGHRDATMVLMAYRHGLRVSELVALRWDQIDLEAGRLHVIRCKGSDDSVQPLSGVEIRALRRIRREQDVASRHVFVSERGAPMTTSGFFKMLVRAAASIGIDGVHPHLLRHGTGYKLVNDGVDTRSLAAYLGHRNMSNTARYTKLNARRFEGFWRD